MTETPLMVLERLEEILCEMIMEKQDDAEAEPGFTSRFSSDTGPICVPEDAAPELDEVRSLILCAIDILRQQE